MVAKPRDSKSPNFKAFESIKTKDCSQTKNYEFSPSPMKNKRFELLKRDIATENLCFSEMRSNCTEKPHYLDLSKNATETIKRIQPTGLLENSAKRLSHQLSFDKKSKDELENFKKRHSTGENGLIASRFKQYK